MSQIEVFFGVIFASKLLLRNSFDKYQACREIVSAHWIWQFTKTQKTTGTNPFSRPILRSCLPWPAFQIRRWGASLLKSGKVATARNAPPTGFGGSCGRPRVDKIYGFVTWCHQCRRTIFDFNKLVSFHVALTAGLSREEGLFCRSR